MSRFWIWVGLMATTLGCQGSASPFAPYGPTQVPPPPTGSAQRSDPYYRRAAVDDPRLSQRRFNSVDDVPGSGIADRRASPGYRDGASIGRGYDDRAAKFGTGSPVAEEPAEFRNSGAEFSDLRSASNLGWRSPLPANDSYVEPAASFSGRPRPQFR